MTLTKIMSTKHINVQELKALTEFEVCSHHRLHNFVGDVCGNPICLKMANVPASIETWTCGCGHKNTLLLSKAFGVIPAPHFGPSGKEILNMDECALYRLCAESQQEAPAEPVEFQPLIRVALPVDARAYASVS